MDIEIGEIQKNSVSKIKVASREYKGRGFIDIRTFFQNEAGEWEPTKKGIAISPDKVGELIHLLNTAMKKT
ncbi:MAG: transcriptional coactivator p15/PC4 family protein [Pseudomonadota bacterium]